MKKFLEQFREIQPKFSRLYTRLLAQARLTQPQYAVLLELAQAGRPVTMTAVSCKLYITKPAVTSLVDRLEKKGFLKRLNDPEDRRVSLLQILPKGKKIVEKVREEFLTILVRAARQFNTKDRNTVQRFYAVLSRNLDSILSCPKEN